MTTDDRKHVSPTTDDRARDDNHPPTEPGPAILRDDAPDPGPQAPGDPAPDLAGINSGEGPGVTPGE
jgi:hypothetical protein